MGTNTRSPGWPLLARRELQDQVLAGGALHRPLHHLDVAGDAVLLVHDGVAGAQLHRVDGVLAPAGHALADVLGAGPAGAGQVALGQQDGLEQVAAEAGLEAAGRELHDAGLAGAVVEPGGHLGVLEQLVQPLRRTVPLGGDDDAPAVLGPVAQVGDGPLDLAAVGRRRLRGEHDGVVLEVLVGGERADASTTAGRSSPRAHAPRPASGRRPRRGRSAPARRPTRSTTTPRGTPGWCGRGRARACAPSRGR